MRRLLALLAVLAMFAVACGGGGDDDSSDGDTTDSSTTTEAPDTSAPADDDSDGDSDGTTAASSDDPWCIGAAAVQARFDEAEATGMALQDRFRLQFEELLPDQMALLRDPPGPIAEAAMTYADALEELGDILAAVDYNFFALDEADAALLDDPAIDAASNEVEDYVRNVCGIEEVEAEGADGLVLSDDEIDALLSGPQRDEILGSLVQLGLDEDAAECVMRDALSSGANVLGEVDDELLQVFTDCGVSLETLAAIGLGTTEEDVNAQLVALTSLFTPELQQALQASDAAKQGLVGVFTTQGLDQAAAECVVDTLTELEDLTVLQEVDSAVELFLDCGITLDDLANLG